MVTGYETGFYRQFEQVQKDVRALSAAMNRIAEAVESVALLHAEPPARSYNDLRPLPEGSCGQVRETASGLRWWCRRPSHAENPDHHWFTRKVLEPPL